MKKFRGKALAALLSLALIASSFPVTLASASTKHATGVLTDDPDNDEFWLVNGGDKDERSVTNFQDYIYVNGAAPLETADHQDVDDPEVYSISHVSGDKLVSWDIGDDDDDDDSGEVKLSLRKSDSEGDEVIAVLYKGTYTDDDDNEVSVTASTQITIHAVDENSTVIGDAGDMDGDYFADDGAMVVGTDSPELDGDDDDDDNFAEIATAANDYKAVSVFKAEKNADSCLAQWKAVPTVSENALEDEDDFIDQSPNDIYYVLESSNDDDLDVTSNGVSLIDGGKSGLTASATTSSKVVDFTNDTSNTYYAKEAGASSATTITAKAGTTAGSGMVTVSNIGDSVKVYSDSACENLVATYVYRAPLTSVATSASLDSDSGTLPSDLTLGAISTTATFTNASSTTAYNYYIGDALPASGNATGSIAVSDDTTTSTMDDGDKLFILAAADVTWTSTPTPLVTYTYNAAATAGDTGFSQFVYATVKNDAGTANITLKGKVTDAQEDNVADDDDIKSKVKIEKKAYANDTLASDDASYTIYKDSDNDYQLSYKADSSTAAATTEIDSGFVVKFVTDNGNFDLPDVTVNDDASLDGIKGYVGKLTIDDAKKVGTVDLKKGDVSVEDSDVKVDSITTKNNAVVSIDADNDVGAITIKDDDAGDSSVSMTSGSATSITSKGTVDLEGTEDDEPISVGTVKAQKISIDSDDGAVTVNSIVSSAPTDDEGGCTIELFGDQSTIKAIDFAGYGVDMQAEDFQGEIPAPENATADDAIFETTDEDDDITFTGDVDINAVTIEDDSKVVFNGKLSVDDLDGSGTMYIGANKLYVGDDASGVLVKVTDNTITAGSTIFTAATDTVDDDDLDFYGFTVKCNEGKSTDTFVVDQLQFAGLAMNKTSDKIVLNESATYTATAYAPGTSLPEGYSIEFDIDDNSGVFELTDNGNGTATVKCVDFDDVFSDENKATLEAYVVDEDGDEDEDYGMAECNLTALKTPEKTFTSDTNNDFTLASGATYQFKITDASAAPVMTAGTAGVVDIANVGKSGNDYFIKVTAKGAANAKTGIYVNGTKLLVITVGGVVCDTTTDITVKKGASYQYKVTASAAPTFGFGTAGVFTSQLVSHSGNNYFYKVTAVGAAGASTGVYVNGQKVNVAKVG
ncbi:hypothetical protein EQM14_05005 [Caproiciproducens sp. NJN-50]|uniref:hypothetical protein n=1 Tax=Caproiciproducens sp. NJN-50 TaxID=2507162 RepID=UPI000FFE3121|nr:hypothetical protein [Caproiciproducens sp. NJN-50]QAT49184.1 hypothetical protein EQM14_05005 [Caproiciproducens sp. NJN-50]